MLSGKLEIKALPGSIQVGVSIPLCLSLGLHVGCEQSLVSLQNAHIIRVIYSPTVEFP